MMAKREKLIHCGYCRRPMWLLGFDPQDWVLASKEELKLKRKFVEKMGPHTHPKIKRWCDGSCDGLILHLYALMDLPRRSKKSKSKKLDWLLLNLELFKFELVEYLKARDKNKVPMSDKKKRMAIEEKIRRLRSKDNS